MTSGVRCALRSVSKRGKEKLLCCAQCSTPKYNIDNVICCKTYKARDLVVCYLGAADRG